MSMEIFGHEFWSSDGKISWYNLQTPRGEAFWLAGYEVATGKKTWYRLERNEWSIRFKVTHLDKVERKEMSQTLSGPEIRAELIYHDCVDEGGSWLLDNSMVTFGYGINCGNLHLEHDLPIAIAGRGKGTLKPGRRLRFPKCTPLCNLYLSMLHRLGIEGKSFGDSTGVLPGLG
ncbi:MAG TPA: hypothetical protein VNV86_08820 [Candidatus Acidoferrum sp.]|nr:hypothetical protein [Candidatus Acidoferrum sp.]